MATPTTPAPTASAKTEALTAFKLSADGAALRTNSGLAYADDVNSLRAGVRGPTLLEDHLLREKITHFDHERIPERVVHARGVRFYLQFLFAMCILYGRLTTKSVSCIP